MRTILGRRAESARLDQLLGKAKAGQSDALVLRGAAGIGKTALLEDAARRAGDCRIVRVVGVESEGGLPFAALHQLCAPLLEGIGRLPVPQRDALGTAFGLTSGAPADRFLVGLAVLSLLSDGAESQPLLCLVDDAQWLDRSSAQVLSFVARRLPTGSVIILFAERDHDGFDALAGLPELPLQPLSDGEARALFASAHPGPLDERVRDRMIAEARGNPRSVLESALGLSGPGVAGGYGVPDIAPLPDPVETTYRQHVKQLPLETQRLLLVASAEPTGDPTLLWRAAAALDIPLGAGTPAESHRLIVFGPRVAFGHSLLRSAIYHSASREERSGAHRVLAELIDPEMDPDQHAWHRAQAALAPAEDVATQLEESAGRAQRRGGLAAAAAFLEGATRLTSEPARQGERALAAARAKHHSGELDAAIALLAMAQARPLNDLQWARVKLIDAQIAFEGALLDGRVAATPEIVEKAIAARVAFLASTPPAPADLLLDGLARLVTEGYGAATPILRHALRTFRTGDLAAEGDHRWLWLAGIAAMALWDDDALHAIATRHGGTGADDALIDAVLASAGRGRDDDPGMAMSSYRAAVLSNGLGRYGEAFAAAEGVCQHDDLALTGLGLAELVEAAARSGRGEVAAAALRRLEERTDASATDWALGTKARSRALLSDGGVAERLHREAIERLGRTRFRTELARAHLVYGEWLRRSDRRLDARDQLRTAHGLFTSLGIEGFADRARRELLTTGETVRRRSDETRYDLTAQEAQIARLAGDGRTNPEIGTELFLSARTVEWHLRKVFAKLGISSRKELRRALEAGQLTGAQTAA